MRALLRGNSRPLALLNTQTMDIYRQKAARRTGDQGMISIPKNSFILIQKGLSGLISSGSKLRLALTDAGESLPYVKRRAGGASAHSELLEHLRGYRLP